MANELNGKVAAVTGAASGIGLASAEAMVPLRIDLLDLQGCGSLLPPWRGERPDRAPLVGLAPASRPR